MGEKLLCAFQWDMSGIDVHANTDIGHHTSTLVRTMTSIALDFEGQEKHKAHRSSSNVASPKTQSARFVRKTPSTTKVGHKRSVSVHHRPSLVDNSYSDALEQKLAKQTRKVQQLRYSGANPDVLRAEEAILRTTEQELAKTMQRHLRHQRSGGLSMHTINQLFSPRSLTTAHERTGSMPRKISTAVRTKLFSLTEEKEKASVPASPVQSGSKSRSSPLSLHHRRYKSDVTGMKPATGSSPTPTPPVDQTTPTPPTDQPLGDFELAEDAFEAASPPRATEGVEMSPPKEIEGFALPSIDIEFNVTISVDQGKIVLRTEDR